MKLLCSVGPNSQRVRIFCAEKGIDVPRVEVDLLGGETRTAEFLALNSLGQVPVLVLDDGLAITESVAICRYLEELHPEPALFGADAVGCARVEMWNRRMEIVIFGTIGGIGMHTFEFFKDRLTQVSAFADSLREALPRKWAWLDAELADGRPYIAGDDFSVADITGMVAANLGEGMGLEIPASAANVRRWRDRVGERPSWRA